MSTFDHVLGSGQRTVHLQACSGQLTLTSENGKLTEVKADFSNNKGEVTLKFQFEPRNPPPPPPLHATTPASNTELIQMRERALKVGFLQYQAAMSYEDKIYTLSHLTPEMASHEMRVWIEDLVNRRCEAANIQPPSDSLTSYDNIMEWVMAGPATYQNLPLVRIDAELSSALAYAMARNN